MKPNKIIQANWFKVTIIVISVAFTAATLSRFANLINHLINLDYNWQFEFFVVLGMIIFQYPFIYKKWWSLKLNYYYNMLLVSLIGASLLWPLLILNQYSNFSDTFNLLYFFAVVMLMFFDHKRRVTKLQLPVFISYSWVLYRLIILIFIL